MKRAIQITKQRNSYNIQVNHFLIFVENKIDNCNKSNEKEEVALSEDD